MSEYAERHGLDRLRAADPAGFGAAMERTAAAGAAMPRLDAKESGPASIFRPAPTAPDLRKPGNDPALMQANPAASLPHDSPDAARLAAEVTRIDAAVAEVTATLDFFEEPGHYAAAQRRLA